LKSGGPSGVREGFVERGVLTQLAALENRAAIETFQILGIIVLSDDSCALVFAGLRHGEFVSFLTDYSTRAGRAGRRVRLTKPLAALSLVPERI
jgi:hypothetical protein